MKQEKQPVAAVQTAILLSFNTPAETMNVKRHATDAEKVKDSAAAKAYAELKSVPLLVTFRFQGVDAEAFCGDLALRGLRLEAQAAWREDHDDLHTWLQSHPKVTHEKVERYALTVDVAELMARPAKVRGERKPTTAGTAKQIEKLGADQFAADLEKANPELYAKLKALMMK